MISKNLNIKPETALFLDRDGVINRRLPGTYVKYVSEFEFLPGVLEAFSIFAKRFNHIFVVTNQQGIGKGYMNEQELQMVHQYLISEVQAKGGKIDKVYFAPSLAEENSLMRKPNTGMAITAKQDFPMIDLSNSFMVGDSVSDMEFGKNANMQCIFIHSNTEISVESIPFDLKFDSLIDFAYFVENNTPTL